MKHGLMVLLACFVANVTVAQTTASWKDKVVGKWHYDGTEEFGVVTPADSLHSGDWLQINADGTFTASEKNKETTGTFKIDEAAKTITFKDAAGKAKLYYLKKSNPSVLLMESQTPDLIRTRHRYSAVR